MRPERDKKKKNNNIGKPLIRSNGEANEAAFFRSKYPHIAILLSGSCAHVVNSWPTNTFQIYKSHLVIAKAAWNELCSESKGI